GEVAKMLLEVGERLTRAPEVRAPLYKPRPATRGSGWASHLENVQGYQPRTQGLLNVLDVLYLMAQDDQDGGPASFWRAFQAFVREHRQFRYLLSPVDVIRWKRGISPTG